MAAPQSNPDLSVVSTDEAAGAEKAAAPDTKATEQASPSAEPAPAETTAPPKRKGVPIWALVAVAIVGLLAFFSQYQRAQTLDARVNSLVGELEVAGEKLKAYQAHLADVRVGVSDLTERVGSLKALVDSDPLAPAPEAGEAAAAVPAAARPAPEAAPAPREEPGPVQPTAQESVTLPTPDPAAAAAAGGGEGAIREGALSTPFNTESPELGLQGEALPDLETLLAPGGSRI